MDPSFFARKRPREEGRPAPPDIRPHIGRSNPPSDDRPVFLAHARSPARNPQYVYHSIARQISTTTLPANRPKPATTTRERPTSVLEPPPFHEIHVQGRTTDRTDARDTPWRTGSSAMAATRSSKSSTEVRVVVGLITSHPLSHVLPYSRLPRQAERPWSIAAST